MGGKKRLVVLIEVELANKVMKIERWEDVPSTRHRRRSSPLHNPQRRQSLVLNGANEHVLGAQLVLPVSLVYDAVPLELPPGEFSISQQGLADLVNDCFNFSR